MGPAKPDNKGNVLTIRPATPADSAMISILFIESRKRHVAFAKLVHSEVEIHQWFRDTVIPRGQTWIVENAGAVCAFMTLSTSGEEGWIDQLYVHPDMTGRGYGAALVHAARAELPSPIFLHTFQQNQRARRFYEREGFVAVKFTDGDDNEEHCPDVLYRWSGAE